MLRRLKNDLRQLFLGDRGWGCLRSVLIVVSLVLLTRYAHNRFPHESVEHLVQTWLDRTGMLKLLTRPVLRLAALLAIDYRFMWLAIAGLVSALVVAASYLRQLFDLPSRRYTLRYLVSAVTSLFYPSLEIDKGRLQVEKGATNLVRDLGGPGYLRTQPGNLVVLEHLHKPAGIQAEGSHFLSRFETLKLFSSDRENSGWEVPTVEDQHGFVDKVKATTKDGITLQVENINYRYRLRMGRAYGDFARRDPQHPNPFSVEAVAAMAYNRTVRLTRGVPELTPWHAMINIAVEGAVTDHIREHLFNEVVVPSFPEDPRQEIHGKLFAESIRARLRTNGAELLWCDIGHFKILDPRVADQLVENWGTVWQGEAQVRRAFGEARRIELLERGRAEAQAEMLAAIMDAFENLALPGESREKIANLLLARTAQLIEGLRDRRTNPNERELPPFIE